MSDRIFWVFWTLCLAIGLAVAGFAIWAVYRIVEWLVTK